VLTIYTASGINRDMETQTNNYYPEMNESPAPGALFKSGYVYNCYTVVWPVSRDAEARAFLRAARIRAVGKAGIQFQKLGEYSHLRYFKEDGYSMLVSFKGHAKLHDAGLIVTERLLD
jgi:hypothetical protein